MTIDLPAEEVAGKPASAQTEGAGPPEAAAKREGVASPANTTEPVSTPQPETPAKAERAAAPEGVKPEGPKNEAVAPAAPPAAPKPESKPESPKSDTPPKPGAASAAAASQSPPRPRPPETGDKRKPAAEEPVIPSAFAQSPRKAEAAPRTEARVEARPPSMFPLIAAGLGGGAVVALVVAALALAGFFRPPPPEPGPDYSGDIAALQEKQISLEAEVASLSQAPATDDLSPLREQLAGLEQSVSALQNAEPAPALDDAALQAMQRDIATLEERLTQAEDSALAAAAAVGGPDNEAGAQIAARLGALSSQVDAVTGEVETLTGDVEALKSVPPPDLSGLEGGLASLREELDALSAKMDELPRSDRVAAIEARLGEIGGAAEKAAALGPAVAADALASELQAGRPFVTELAALKTLGVDAEAVAALEPHAETGLPTLAQIRSRFEAEVASADLTAPIPEGTGALDRLLGSARNLVDVRPANPTEGADPGAIVSRMRGALADGDLKTALAEWDTLPEELKTASTDWSATVETRAAADDLVARLRADALSRLESEG